MEPAPVARAPRGGHDFGQLSVFDAASDAGAGEPAGLSANQVIQRAASGGAPLDDAVRPPLEAAFQTDLGAVRIHDDAEANRISQSLSAHAFTTGNDIFFASGEYAPATRGGRELLAHELTHVVQQRAGTATPGGNQDITISDPNGPDERAADAVSQHMTASAPSLETTATTADLAMAEGATIQRDVVDDVVLGATDLYHDVVEGVGLESPDEADAARLQAFIDHGTFGPEALVPPTNIGGFDASFDPQSNVLLIEVRTGINFTDGLAMDASNVITANHTDLAQAAVDGMSLDPADRAAFVEQFIWSPDQQDAFIASLQARVQDAWSGQYVFLCTHSGWESMFAGVQVEVDVHEGARGDEDHLQTTTYKVPDGGTYSVGAFVQSHGDQDAHNNELVMSSTDVNETPVDQSLLRKTVLFANDSAELTPDAITTLNAFERDFQDANLDLTNPVELVGHASSPGTEDHNQRLAQRRIDAVRDHLAGIGFTGINDRVTTENAGEEGATEDPEWRRVDLIVGTGEGQLVASHEFGHVFGLADEYVSNDVNPGGSITGSGSAVGTAVAHDQLAKAIGTTGAIAENNDDIMSLGNTVQPKHYATFGWALAQVTGIEEWVVA